MKLIFTLSFLIISFCGISQEITIPSTGNTSIQADRPDQTESAFLVPKGFFQMENGFLYEKNVGSDYLTFPSALCKFGINEYFELRLIVEAGQEKVLNSRINGIQPLTIGFKTKISKERGIIPETSFIGHFGTARIGSEDFKTLFPSPSFRFCMAHSLKNDFSLSYNLGAEWSGSSPESVFLYTLTLGKAFENLGMYIEAYGYSPSFNSLDQRLDAGITYLLNDNFLLDVSAGLCVDNSDLDYYAALGFSFRLPVIK